MIFLKSLIPQSSSVGNVEVAPTILATVSVHRAAIACASSHLRLCSVHPHSHRSWKWKRQKNSPLLDTLGGGSWKRKRPKTHCFRHCTEAACKNYLKQRAKIRYFLNVSGLTQSQWMWDSITDSVSKAVPFSPILNLCSIKKISCYFEWFCFLWGLLWPSEALWLLIFPSDLKSRLVISTKYLEFLRRWWW